MQLLEIERRQLQRWALRLQPMARIVLLVSVVGWLLLLLFRDASGQQLFRSGLIITSLLGLLALALPAWSDSLAGAARRLGERQMAIRQLRLLLHERLTDGWTLYEHLTLPDGERMPPVLVGPTGVYTLTLLHSTSTMQNSKHLWLQKQPNGDWNAVRRSPSRKAERDAEMLQDVLEQPVAARLLWTSSAMLLINEPATPVWRLDDPDQIVAGLSGRQRLDDDALDQIEAILRRYA